MPGGLSHYLLARTLVGSLEGAGLAVDEDMLLFGAQMPDAWYFYRPLSANAVNPGVLAHRHSGRALFAALREAADGVLAESFAYGYLSHYAFDAFAHPYVYAWERRLQKETSAPHARFHFRIESDLDILLARELLGEDLRFPYAAWSEPGKVRRAAVWPVVQKVFWRSCERELDPVGLDRCWRIYKRVCRLRDDPAARKHRFVTAAERFLGLGHPLSVYLPSPHPDPRVLNADGAAWTSPFGGRARTESFPDLFDRALGFSRNLCEAFSRGDIDERFGLHLLEGTPEIAAVP